MVPELYVHLLKLLVLAGFCALAARSFYVWHRYGVNRERQYLILFVGMAGITAWSYITLYMTQLSGEIRVVNEVFVYASYLAAAGYFVVIQLGN